MPALADIRARVRARLEEQTAAVWTDAELDEVITASTEEYSLRFPRQLATPVAVASGAWSCPVPAGSLGIVRVTLADGYVVPKRGRPAGKTSDEWLAWEEFAGLIHFSRPLAAQTLTVWSLTGHSVAEVPSPDVGLLVAGAVWRALEQRSVQALKRGGPANGVSLNLVVRQARDEYQRVFDLRCRRLRAL
jgi:hypothetical protein